MNDTIRMSLDLEPAENQAVRVASAYLGVSMKLFSKEAILSRAQRVIAEHQNQGQRIGETADDS